MRANALCLWAADCNADICCCWRACCLAKTYKSKHNQVFTLGLSYSKKYIFEKILKVNIFPVYISKRWISQPYFSELTIEILLLSGTTPELKILITLLYHSSVQKKLSHISEGITSTISKMQWGPFIPRKISKHLRRRKRAKSQNKPPSWMTC